MIRANRPDALQKCFFFVLRVIRAGRFARIALRIARAAKIAILGDKVPLGQKNGRTKVPRIFRIFGPNFAPILFPRFFLGVSAAAFGGFSREGFPENACIGGAISERNFCEICRRKSPQNTEKQKTKLCAEVPERPLPKDPFFQLLRVFVLPFVGSGDQKKIHQKSPPFFNAEFPGEFEEKIHKSFLVGLPQMGV